MNYSGIDLHSNNSVVSVIDETDRVIAERRLPNDLAKILASLPRGEPSWQASWSNLRTTGTGLSTACRRPASWSIWLTPRQ